MRRAHADPLGPIQLPGIVQSHRHQDLPKTPPPTRAVGPLRFRFFGTLRIPHLAEILPLSDLHIYLTVSLVLSWLLLNTLAWVCIALASNTAPVREVIPQENNELLLNFFGTEGLTSLALRVHWNPPAYRTLGVDGRALAKERYRIEYTLPAPWQLLKQVLS